MEPILRYFRSFTKRLITPLNPILAVLEKEPQSFWPDKHKMSLWLYFSLSAGLHLFILHMLIIVNLTNWLWYRKLGRALFLFTVAYGYLFSSPGDANLFQYFCLKSSIFFITEVSFCYFLTNVPYFKGFFYFHLGKDYIEDRVGNPFTSALRNSGKVVFGLIGLDSAGRLWGIFEGWNQNRSATVNLKDETSLAEKNYYTCRKMIKEDLPEGSPESIKSHQKNIDQYQSSTNAAFRHSHGERDYTSRTQYENSQSILSRAANSYGRFPRREDPKGGDDSSRMSFFSQTLEGLPSFLDHYILDVDSKWTELVLSVKSLFFVITKRKKPGVK